MRTWRHASQQMFCGGPCRQLIAKGAPYLELLAPEWKRPKVRCETCAGEPPRFDVATLTDDARPARIEHTTMTAMQQLTGSFQPSLGLDEGSR